MTPAHLRAQARLHHILFTLSGLYYGTLRPPARGAALRAVAGTHTTTARATGS